MLIFCALARHLKALGQKTQARRWVWDYGVGMREDQARQKNENKGDRWTFVAVLPDSSFIHTLHHEKRNLEQATESVGQIKSKSDL